MQAACHRRASASLGWGRVRWKTLRSGTGVWAGRIAGSSRASARVIVGSGSKGDAMTLIKRLIQGWIIAKVIGWLRRKG